jgi:hypothetical protein
MAWASKGQTEPFLIVSLAAPALAALLARRWIIAAACASSLAGAYIAVIILRRAANALLIDPHLPQSSVSGLLSVVAVVTAPFNRAYALSNLLSFGLPTLLGMLWAMRGIWRERAAAATTGSAAASWYLRLTLLAFAGSWLAWFATLSVGVPRYMAPPVFIGCIFVAALLRDLTGGFALRASVERLLGLLTMRQPSWAGAAALLALLIVATAFPLCALGLARYYPERDQSAQRVAAALNAMPAGTRVETYESELHFLLTQPYHYPPDQIHVELNRRSLLGEQVPIPYDPLAANPDFLVVGTFARGNGLYVPAITSGAFRLLRQDGQYELYQRVR